MSHMKQHLDTADEGSRTINVRTLPAVYPLYHQDSAFLGYRTLRCLHLITVSYGEFQLHSLPLKRPVPSGQCSQFAIREPTLPLTPLNPANLPRRGICRCLYTVTAFPTEHEMCWDLSAVLKYAGSISFPANRKLTLSLRLPA